ncbi:MAG: hypothetical protein JXR60_09375 [Bacteroidales bacterium]|nr:hypothetical protein [Bacteroidales bacterium]
MKFKNYLLVFGLAVAVGFSSCKKDNDDDNTTSKPAPKVEMSSNSNGEVISIPANVSTNIQNDQNLYQLSGAVSNINAVGSFLTALNSVPENAEVTNRSTNSSVTYHWTYNFEGGSYEYWYTVEESGVNYNLTYEIAVNSEDLTIPRTTYIEGWVSQTPGNGHLQFNFDAFTSGTTNYNYVYEWDTNSIGTFHLTVDWNVDDSQYGYYAGMHYVAYVYADGSGQVDYSYTDQNTAYLYHYDWNADWSIIHWSYSINGTQEGSGTWPEA